MVPKQINFKSFVKMHKLIVLPAADRTFSASEGNEKERNTIVADAAILAPSPESFTLILVGCTPSSFSS